MTGKHRSHCCSSLHKLLVPLIFLCGSPFIHAEAGPDLSAEQLDAGAVRTDPQTLLLSGTLAVTVKNGGGAPAPANISVTVFSDTNLNGAYDAGIDASLGEAFIENPLAAAESITLDIAVNGQMPFRDAPITVWADSAQSVAESDEENNFSTGPKHCGDTPAAGAPEPVLKWERNGGRVAHAPIAGPLLDTDGNGAIDEHDTPAVIVLEGYSLAALDGKTGAVLWRNDRRFRTFGVTPALGDLDGDGKPEIVTYLPGRKVIALNNDGTEKWISEAVFDMETALDFSGLAIVDLDADGQAEILAANLVLNADGSVKWAGSQTPALTPVAADLDKDGSPEVLAGQHVYRADGTPYWRFPSRCGFYFAAIADFDGDAYPEIVSVTAGKISLFEHDGTIKWGPVDIAGVPAGSPPAIADLDGDGMPEIGIGGTAYFRVFNSDGSLKWQTPVFSLSGAAGASIFDFESDGRAEILYQDAETLYIFAGDSGEILFDMPNASATWIEYPVIADIDNDGHADLLAAGSNGIRAFQDAGNAWASARGIWNQHAYRAASVDNDGGIPLLAENHWETDNRWRAARIPGGNDLSAGYLRIADNGPGRGFALQVRIGNAGISSVGASVAFYSGDPASGGALLKTADAGALEPGAWRDVLTDGIDISAFGQKIYALADAALPECKETNNMVSLVWRIISGHVRDDSGAPVAGAELRLEGRPETFVTNEDGYYRMSGLEEGVYTLSAAKEGYVFQTAQIVLNENNTGAEIDLACTVCGGAPGYAPGYILIARETGHNEIIIRDGEGSLIRRFDTGTTGSDISVATGDFFGDGADRIVVNADKLLQFYDFDGEKLAELPVEKQGDVAAGDIDGDGMEEALTTAKSANDNRVTIYGADGEVWTMDLGFAGKNTRLSVAAADFDGDGAAEIVAGTLLKDNKAALYSADGMELAVFEVFSDVNARTVRKPGEQGNACSHSGQGVPKFCEGTDADDDADPDGDTGTDEEQDDEHGGSGKKHGVNVAAGDLDGDGVPELVAGMAGKGGIVEVYAASGGLIHRFSAFDDSSGVEINAGDTDGDGTDEIIAGNAKGTEVRIFKADGTLVRAFTGLDRERIGSLAFARGTAPVTAAAVDAGLQPVPTDAEFFGGVSVSGKPRKPKAVMHTGDSVKITAKIKADKKHAGKRAKIITLFNYFSGGPDLPSQDFILNAEGIVLPWDGDPDTLTGADGIMPEQGKTLNIYEGRLPQGVINIFFGYRAEDGTLVFSGSPVSITVNGGK